MFEDQAYQEFDDDEDFIDNDDDNDGTYEL